VFERYTEPARRTIFLARWWALNRKTITIDTSDLILGAAEETSRSSSKLHWINLDYPRIVALFAGGVVVEQNPNAKDLPLSDSSKRALAYAVEEAERDGRYSIDVHHLVRGVLRTGDTAAKALGEAGYTLESLRKSSVDTNRAIPDATTRAKFKRTLYLRGWRLWRTRSTLILGIAFLLFVAAIAYLHYQQ